MSSGYGNFLISGTSPAAAGPAVIGNVAGPLTDFESLSIAASLVGATGGTLDVYIQYTPDEGATWFDIVHFPQLLAGAAAIKYIANIARFAQPTVPVVSGDTLLAVNTIVQGEFGNQLRCKVVAGAGTSAGAAVLIKILANRVAALRT